MPLFTVKPPNGASLFTLTNNAASATHSFNDGAHAMNMRATDTGAASTERVRFRGKAVPAGSSWDATLGIWTTPFGRAANLYYRIGLAVLENSTGKNLAVMYNTQNQAPEINTYSLTALGTFGAVVGLTYACFGGRFPILFRISYDGTNYTMQFSLDFGDSWVVDATLAKASYFTADRIGMWIETFGTFTASEPRLEAFYYSDPDFP